ncbi:hypothetical protein ACVWWG_005216 [Bradyrhizobium sp. LB7.2]
MAPRLGASFVKVARERRLKYLPRPSMRFLLEPNPQAYLISWGQLSPEGRLARSGRSFPC